MANLSVVIIAFNEEKNIERCLSSVQDIADEVVVVDSFSNDSTGLICEKFNAKVIKHAFEGHIEQKNWAITQTEYPHILSLDADEALSEELRESILKVKENWLEDGYCFNRLTNFCGKWVRHCGWYPDTKLRLFKKETGRWGGMNPHDKFVPDPGMSIKHIKGDLLHYSFDTISEHMNQINKFSQIRAEELMRKGRRFNYLKLFLGPCWKFIKGYILQLGFLDGFTGYLICKNSAYSGFLKYAKQRELTKPGRK